MESQASYCRTKLNRVTARSLYTALMEMRRLDVTRESVLSPGDIDEVILGHGVPLRPCLPFLHSRFRDARFRRSTNYEKLMTYLEVRSPGRTPGTRNMSIIRRGCQSDRGWGRRRSRTGQTGTGTRGCHSGSITPRHYQQQMLESQGYTFDLKSKIISHYFLRKFAMLVEDAKLINDLRNSLRHQILDIDVVANRFMELSVTNDQITFDQVVKVLRENNVEFDRNLLSRWIKHSRTSSSVTCSIDNLTDMLRRAVDPVLELEEAKAEQDYPLRVMDSRDKRLVLYEDSNMKQQTHTHSTLKHKESDMKARYLEKLRRALYESVKQHAGYLPVEEVGSLTTAYTTVYNLGLDQGNIAAAINMARSVDIRHGLVSIEMFIHCIQHNCYR